MRSFWDLMIDVYSERITKKRSILWQLKSFTQDDIIRYNDRIDLTNNTIEPDGKRLLCYDAKVCQLKHEINKLWFNIQGFREKYDV